MQVILRENVENLGKTGDIVRVSDGYARNFLLPRQLVMIAEAENVAQIEHHKRVLEKKRKTERMGAVELAAKLAAVTCTVAKKAGEHDKLFGSVTAQDIVDALAVVGVTLERKLLHLAAPIKTLGEHSVEIRLDSDVVASIKVSVVAEA